MLYTDCSLKAWLPTILANRAMCLRSAQKAIRHTRSTLTSFFNSGEYRQYIQLTSRGAQSAGDVIKGKKEWQVGLLVQVNLKELRKRMEKDGIIEGARSIFSR